MHKIYVVFVLPKSKLNLIEVAKFLKVRTAHLCFPLYFIVVNVFISLQL